MRLATLFFLGGGYTIPLFTAVSVIRKLANL